MFDFVRGIVALRGVSEIVTCESGETTDFQVARGHTAPRVRDDQKEKSKIL